MPPNLRTSVADARRTKKSVNPQTKNSHHHFVHLQTIESRDESGEPSIEMTNAVAPGKSMSHEILLSALESISNA